MPKNPHAQALALSGRLTIPETVAELRRLRAKYSREEIVLLCRKAGRSAVWTTITAWENGHRRAPDWIKELK